MSLVKANTYQDASGGSNAVFSGVASPPNSMGFRNRIINGNMVIDQRNAGASVAITTSGNYTVDRWSGNATQNGKYTVQQNAGSVTPPAGYTNYLGVTSSSAYAVLTGDVFWLAQAIEGLNVADLGWGAAGAQTITLSFWVRSSLTGTFGGALRNSAANRSYPFTYSISAANTWEQKSITIAGDTTGTWLTTNGIGINLNLGLGAGSTFSGTAGAWAAGNFVSATGATSVVGTNGATFYITGVQLEAGTVASPFDQIDYGRELIMCQRYFETSYASGTAIGAATSSNGIYSASTSGARTGWHIPYAVVKRAVPTTTVWDFAGTAGRTTQCDPTTGARTNGANNIATNSGGTAALELEIGITSGAYYAVQWASSAEL